MNKKSNVKYSKLLLNEDDVKTLKSRLVPQPRRTSFYNGEEYRVADGCRMRILGPGADAVSRLAKSYWNIEPEVIRDEGRPEKTDPESYSMKITASEIVISAADMAAVRYAMSTLRQLAEVERGRETFSCHLLPQCEISDAPSMPFRGVHMCWFPETSGWQIEKQLRLAAYYKFNHMVLETWGTFPFESHPELCWEDHPGRDEISRLISLGRELGVTLIPQFNMLGHGSGASISNGKHVMLDLNPSLQPLLEPDGWSWCLSNPSTRKLLSDVAAELHDFFGHPSYFHLGFDEAFNIRSCSACRRKPLADLFKDHLLYFHDLFAKRGSRIIIWHDMLLNHQDERWENYVIRDRAPVNLEPLLPQLPKDIVIADWQYKYPEVGGKEPGWDSARFFKEQGFDVLFSPWAAEKATLSMGRLGAREKFAGMLTTTWNGNFGTNLFKIFSMAAQASWNGDWHDIGNADDWQMFNFHIRQMGWDMKLREYAKLGTTKYMRID
ncbi:MAG: family 20 glycosylhydrolase [Victivallales bacterium]